jgi:hypothetical protein
VGARSDQAQASPHLVIVASAWVGRTRALLNRQIGEAIRSKADRADSRQNPERDRVKRWADKEEVDSSRLCLCHVPRVTRQEWRAVPAKKE